MTRLLRWFFQTILLYSLACLALAVGSSLLIRDCLVVDEAYDIVVVLGGGREGEEHVLEQKTGRIHAGVLLYERGIAPRLLLTGGGDPRTHKSSAIALARIARDLGVPDTALTLETLSHSTLQNALFSKPNLPEDARLLLVTEAYHAWRAWASFAWAGRPSAVCASPGPGRTTGDKATVLLREAGSWAVNIPRAAIWSLARALGLQDKLPAFLLS